ncbi:hypothetical protein LVB77_19845 [Lysobacter sp. 5GHs7-4]|uniref:hypothetical protein n=1 Tax=Lysobacter sp. 5GHs7-4 TaxID=2904253 RepID=UPI001E412F8A|nr:hypothetical protein [Lysobacter sp. 5GHs7-4]UHQ22872.1 hypothetical protein LVB77_19845 [Lysobacter sp. 5GHs7-4]
MARTDVVERQAAAGILEALEGSGLEKVVDESTGGAQPGDWSWNKAYARMTAAAVDSGFDVANDPLRGTITLDAYVRDLVNRDR